MTSSNTYCGVMDDSLSREYYDMKFFYEYVQQQQELEQFVNESIIIASDNRRVIENMRIVNEAAGGKVSKFFENIKNFFKKIIGRFVEAVQKTFGDRKKYIDNPKYNNILMNYKYNSGEVEMVDHFTGTARIFAQLNSGDAECTLTKIIPTNMDDNILKLENFNYNGYSRYFNETNPIDKLKNIKNKGRTGGEPQDAPTGTALNSKGQMNADVIGNLNSANTINNIAKELEGKEAPSKDAYIESMFNNLGDNELMNNKILSDSGSIDISRTFTRYFAATTETTDADILTKTFTEEEISSTYLAKMITLVYYGDKLVEKLKKIQNKMDQKLSNCLSSYQAELNKVEKSIHTAIDNSNNKKDEDLEAARKAAKGDEVEESATILGVELYLEDSGPNFGNKSEPRSESPNGTVTTSVSNDVAKTAEGISKVNPNMGSVKTDVAVNKVTDENKDTVKKNATIITTYYNRDREHQFSAMSDLLNTMTVKMTAGLQAALTDYWAVITHHVEYYLANPSLMEDSSNKQTRNMGSGDLTDVSAKAIDTGKASANQPQAQPATPS